MNKYLKLSSILIYILFSCAVGNASAQLQAGAARVDITPDPKAISYPLGGYVSEDRLKNMASSIHDRLYARSVALTNGKSRVVFTSLDLCFMPANVKDAVMKRLPPYLSSSSIMLSATHTHSAPDPLVLHSGNTAAAGKLPVFNPQLLDWFADRIAQSISEAISSMKPACAGAGQMQQIGMNRNRRGGARTDDEMTALKIDSTDGKPIAALFIYAAHPTIYGSDNLAVSGDWSGAFERKMEDKLPGSVVLFINGAEGDVSVAGVDDGTPAERIDVYSGRLTTKAMALYSAIATSPSAKLSSWLVNVDLPPRKAHPLFVLGASMFGATRNQITQYVNNMMPERCVLSFVGVGDFLFMGFPGEPTTAIGLEAKKMARAAKLRFPAVAALTNGWLGYLLPADEYRMGKYEATMSFYGETIGAVMLDGIGRGLKGI